MLNSFRGDYGFLPNFQYSKIEGEVFSCRVINHHLGGDTYDCKRTASRR